MCAPHDLNIGSAWAQWLGSVLGQVKFESKSHVGSSRLVQKNFCFNQLVPNSGLFDLGRFIASELGWVRVWHGPTLFTDRVLDRMKINVVDLNQVQIIIRPRNS